MSTLSTTLTAIQNIADESSKLNKKELLVKYKSHPDVVPILSWLINPLITSGVAKKKMDKTIATWSEDSQIEEHVMEYSIVEFLEWLYKNNTGSQTILNTVYAWILTNSKDPNSFTALTLIQLVTKSWRIGMSPKSINAALNQDVIPEWDIQLAFPYEKKLKLFKNSDLFAVTQKLDGIRCAFVVKRIESNFKIQAFTRSGKEIEGLSDLSLAIKNLTLSPALNQSIFNSGVLFDGELLAQNIENLSSVDLFQYTSKLIRTAGTKSGIEFNLFDIIPLSEFETNSFSQPYSERRRNLDSLTDVESLIQVVPQLDTISMDKIPEWSSIASENGWEGVMLNHVESVYRKTRSKDLLKVKEMHTADLVVVGFKEATEGLFKNTLGAIVVQLDADNTVDVGSGFTAEQRDYIWNHQEEYLGKVVEIQYFEQTTDRFGNKSLRFPVWKNIVRFDKTAKDVNLD